MISCIRGSGKELIQTISAAVAFGKIVFRSLLALLVFQSGRFVRQAGRSSLSLSLSPVVSKSLSFTSFLALDSQVRL